MKHFLHFAVIIVVLFTACGSAATFESPNSLRNINGKLYLNNGQVIEGRLIINTTNTMGSQVKLFAADEKKPQKYNLPEVEGYEIRGEYYALKEIKGGLSFGRNMSFMKCLTKKDSRIQLYENMEQVNTTSKNPNGTNNAANRYETQYYMQFPGEAGNGVWAVNASRFVPNFDEKMSRLVADCPALAKKISNKEPGYFYAQVSLFKEKRAEVLWNIISEYNNCK